MLSKEAPVVPATKESLMLSYDSYLLSTVAINELLYMKNAGAQIAMDFS